MLGMVGQLMIRHKGESVEDALKAGLKAIERKGLGHPVLIQIPIEEKDNAPKSIETSTGTLNVVGIHNIPASHVFIATDIEQIAAPPALEDPDAE